MTAGFFIVFAIFWVTLGMALGDWEKSSRKQGERIIELLEQISDKH